MIVLDWEKNRAQTVALAMRDLITRGVEGSEVIFQQLPPAALPESADTQVRLLAYGIFSGLEVFEPWQAPVFQNGCANHGGGNREVQFRKEHGRVVFRGLVDGAFVNTVIFTLPLGYRPSEFENMAVMADNRFATLVVSPAGLVFLSAADSATPENFASLAGVNFVAD